MVLSRRQACRQKKQIEGCSKNTWNATKILKIQCALQRVILRCLDQSGHMGTFLVRCTPNRHTRWRGQWVLHEKRLDIARFPSVRSSMPACGSSSRLSAQQVPCAWLAERSEGHRGCVAGCLSFNSELVASWFRVDPLRRCAMACSGMPLLAGWTFRAVCLCACVSVCECVLV